MRLSSRDKCGRKWKGMVAGWFKSCITHFYSIQYMPLMFAYDLNKNAERDCGLWWSTAKMPESSLCFQNSVIAQHLNRPGFDDSLYPQPHFSWLVISLMVLLKTIQFLSLCVLSKSDPTKWLKNWVSLNEFCLTP